MPAGTQQLAARTVGKERINKSTKQQKVRRANKNEKKELCGASTVSERVLSIATTTGWKACTYLISRSVEL